MGDDAGRIAGCYIWNPVRLRLGDTTILGAQSVDAAVHPDYQGRGLFTDLARTATEDDGDDLTLVYAFPTEGAFRGQVRVGFQPLFPVAKVYRPLPVRVLRRPHFDALVLREATSFDSRFDAFRNDGSRWELGVERDAGYLQWRYAEHPTRRYDTLVCEQDGEVCGYCVLAIDAARTRVSPGYVVDLQVLPASTPAASYLVFHALRRLRSLGARMAVSWMRPSGPEQEGLERFGFSSRYEAIHRRLKRPRYVDQFIVFERDAGRMRELIDRRGASDPPRWSLVPGDADYT